MGKYLAYYRGNLQNTVVYRGPIVVWLLTDLINLGVIAAVWFSVSGGMTYGGYTKSELMAYYVAAIVFQWATNWFPFYWVSDEIKSGEIALSSLTKPISYFGRQFFLEAGWHTIGLLVGILGGWLATIIFSGYIVWSIPWASLPVLILSMALATIIIFTASMSLGLMAFWFTEIWALESLFWALKTFLGGSLVPLGFVPANIRWLFDVMPFRYMFSFPLEIYFGKISQSQIVAGLAIQIGWVIGLLLLYRFVWQRGRRAYNSYGQ